MKSELYILFLFLNFVRFLSGINFNIPYYSLSSVYKGDVERMDHLRSSILNPV